MPESDPKFRGQLELEGMNRRQPISDVCYTPFMLHSLLTHDDGMERMRGMT